MGSPLLLDMLDYHHTLYAIYMNPAYGPMLADKFDEHNMPAHAKLFRQYVCLQRGDYLNWLGMIYVALDVVYAESRMLDLLCAIIDDTPNSAYRLNLKCVYYWGPGGTIEDRIASLEIESR